ncbi:hypothetical protein PBCVMA1D_084L [Paramecium bursaria Chlorella virus MA1D]|nr:hypothetical protein PBCVMA1D_084L [Paramecium bursaria Chlorella virus MA1D]
MNTIAFHKQMLSDLAHDIEYCITEISRAEFRNTTLTPGYMGFLDFENFSKEEQLYLKSCYGDCHENHMYKMKMTNHLKFLRQRYTDLYDRMEAIKTISTLQINGVLPSVTTSPIMIEDSHVYDDSAFGEKMDWIC